jgi:Icc-related predicted phosphoesterase
MLGGEGSWNTWQLVKAGAKHSPPLNYRTTGMPGNRRIAGSEAVAETEDDKCVELCRHEHRI